MLGFSDTRKNSFFQHAGSAFTLVEILTVMGILAILLAVTLPAFKGLNQGGARRAAVSNLMGALDRARTMAVSDGRATYVAFYATDTPADGTLMDSTGGPWGRAYAIYQDNDNIRFAPVQQTPWLYLPTGMAFKVSNSSGQMASVTNSMSSSLPAVAFPVGSVAARSGTTSLRLPYWKFDVTGSVDSSCLDAAASGPGGTAAYLRVLMFPGYLNTNGGEVSTAGHTVDASTLEEVDLNPVTGRAKYVVNPADNLVTPSPTSSPTL